MLIQFSCKNFKSIKEKQVLSMLATKDKMHEEILKKTDEKFSLLPVASIYGANGSGKTNIIKALGYVSFLVHHFNDFNHGDELPFYPHKLEKQEVPSEFELQFIMNHIRYAYGFSLNNQKIIREYLYYFPKGKQAKIFEREGTTYYFGPSFKHLEDITEKTLVNRLFLSTAASWSNKSEIKDPFIFIKEFLVVNDEVQNQDWLLYTISKIEKNPKINQLFVQFLFNLNMGITDIEAKIQENTVSYDELPKDMPGELKLVVLKSKQIRPVVKINYGNMQMDLREESRGMQKLFEILGPLFDILLNGKVLVFDELETSLHPSLVLRIIELFQNPKLNKNHAQLIFTTHDTNLLDLNLFRRDQIWLVEKDTEEFASNLYSISDLKNVRKDENVEKGYIRGKYGAIPFIGNQFEWLLMEDHNVE